MRIAAPFSATALEPMHLDFVATLYTSTGVPETVSQGSAEFEHIAELVLLQPTSQNVRGHNAVKRVPPSEPPTFHACRPVLPASPVDSHRQSKRQHLPAIRSQPRLNRADQITDQQNLIAMTRVPYRGPGPGLQWTARGLAHVGPPRGLCWGLG